MRNSRLKEGKDSLRPFLTPSPALSAVTPDVSRLGHIHAHPHPRPPSIVPALPSSSCQFCYYCLFFGASG